MKKIKQMYAHSFTKEKLLFITIIFIFINITTYMVYKQSLYSLNNYAIEHPHAGLQFFYYLYCIGINPFLFILFMLLIPNLTSYDFLILHQNRCSYFIETRIGKKEYYKKMFIHNIIFTFLTTLCLQILLVFIIHFFYLPIQFNSTVFPADYYATTQLLSSNECLNLILYILMTSIGYSAVSSLLFSIQLFISNKYIYRCFGVIFGILLVLIPALIQGYLPVPEAAFILQINNLVALGIENVRVNPFQMSDYALYGLCLMIYALCSHFLFHYMIHRREQYD